MVIVIVTEVHLLPSNAATTYNQLHTTKDSGEKVSSHCSFLWIVVDVLFVVST